MDLRTNSGANLVTYPSGIRGNETLEFHRVESVVSETVLVGVSGLPSDEHNPNPVTINPKPEPPNLEPYTR